MFTGCKPMLFQVERHFLFIPFVENDNDSIASLRQVLNDRTRVNCVLHFLLVEMEIRDELLTDVTRKLSWQ